MAPEFGKPIHQLPLIPANVLKKHHVNEPLDPRFRSAARLLRRSGAKTGTCRSAAMSTRMAGAANSEVEFPNRPAGAAATSSPPEIANTARRETAYREIGGLTDFEC
jgi:hypothetical protein